MTPSIANHLWQSTLFAFAAMLLTFALRRNRAQLRYGIWLAASLKFLVPFSVLVGLGNQLQWRAAPTAAPSFPSAIAQIGQPFAEPAMPAPERAASPAIASLPAALWLCGVLAIVVRWYVRWRRVRRAIRAASPLPIRAAIAVLSSPTRLEPGVFGVFRPVLLLPEGLAGRLTPAQFQAILAHEFCHVRRRDNLAAALHMVVEAVFWFHPPVWWIGARLIEERERACDEAVLQEGSDPEAYAAGILNVCKFYLESPLPCASGVTGADLKKRIEAIMTTRILHALTPARKLLLAIAGVAAVAGPIAIGLLHAQPAPLRFEVATIKPTKNSGGRGGIETLPGGALRMSGATVKSLIFLGYGARESEIVGGPAWTASETYEIAAKPEPLDTTADHRPSAPGSKDWNRLQLRIQALLAERFQLVIHRQSKQGPGYALVLAKGGSKLVPTTQENVPPGTVRSMGQINGRAAPVTMLATVLSNWLGRPVEDRTGLTGRYDYKLEYAQESPGIPTEAGPPSAGGPSVFTALQEQLGLKLEPARVTAETIFIDSVQRPSAN